MFHLGSRSMMLLKGSFVIESLGMVFLLRFQHWIIFCFVWRNLSRHWSWLSSSWVCITSVRQLQHHSMPSTNHRCFHPFARSWDGTVTLVAFSQQKEPEHYHSRTATQPHCSPEWYHLMTAPHHACRHCFFSPPLALLPSIQCLLWSIGSASTSHEPWNDYLLPHFAMLYLVAISKIFGQAQGPHQRGHKTKLWLGSLNQPTLSIQQTFTRALSWFSPNLTATRTVHPMASTKDVKLQVTTSSRRGYWPLLLRSNDRPW